MDIESEFAKLCFQNLDYLSERDFDRANKYLEHPELYDFEKILASNY